MPKPVLKVRDMLQAKGVALDSLTPAGLKDLLPAKEFNALGSCMRSNFAPNARASYDDGSADTKREWLMKLLLDPAVCKKTAEHVNEVTDRQRKKAVGAWLTEHQLAAPDRLNNADHAAKMVKTLPSRPHEVAELAQDGVLQYWYTEKTETLEKDNVQTARLTASSELTDPEYKQVLGDMKDASGAAPPEKRKTAVSHKREESPQTKARRVAKQQRDGALRDLKRKLDDGNTLTREADAKAHALVNQGASTGV